MSDNKKKIKKEIYIGLELPPSALLGESKISINSNKEAVIEGCRSIIEYQDDRIKLNLGNKTVLFTGRNLSIDSLTVNGVVLSGIITGLEF